MSVGGELLRAALGEQVPLRLFIDALRLYVGMSPIYMDDVPHHHDHRFADELPEESIEEAA